MNINSCIAQAKELYKRIDRDDDDGEGDLERVNKRTIPIGGGRGGHFDEHENRKRKAENLFNDEDEDEADSDGDSDGGGQGIDMSNCKPIGVLPKEKRKKKRVNHLHNKLTVESGNVWKCKYCNTGDGKIDGLSSYNLKIIYSMEDDLRYMKPDQFVTTIVDKFNELVVEENQMRNPQERMEPLTYDEYELHLELCFGRRNVKEFMWRRIERYTEKIDYIGEHGELFRSQTGQLLLNHKDTKAVVSYENICKGYLAFIDRIETRERKEKEKEKQRLRNQLSRVGKSYYDK
jgi:hypothetical protein